MPYNNIYNITYTVVVENLLPPFLRNPKWRSWMNSLIYPVQWLRDYIFDYWYSSNSSYIYWDWFYFANKYTYVRFQDNSVWMTCIDSVNLTQYNPMANQLMDLSGNTVWFKILPDFIGFQERNTYNNQKMRFEYLLNKYFNPYNYTDKIYIENINSKKSFYIGEYYNNPGDSVTIAQTDITSLFSIGQTDDFDVNYNYIVWVPFQISLDYGANYVGIISSMVDKYNFYGLTYSIQTY